MRPRVLVIAGVTAAGKTTCALEIARRFSGELIGADSVQVYRGFDVGSAKPTAAELAGTPHHLIDVLDADETIDAARYAGMADAAIAEAAGRGALPIVVGGTGLWLRALLRGLVALPPVDPAVRAALEDEASRLGVGALHRRLSEVDERAAARIDPNDRLRIVRALEVFQQTGVPLGVLQEAHRLGAPRYEALTFVLDRPRDALYDALRARIGAMLAAGWVDEVRALIARWGPDVRPLGSVGYRQVAEHVRGEIDLEETQRRAYAATRTYTRRQRTWFRGDPGDKTWTTADELLTPEHVRAIEAFVRAS